MLDSHTHTQKTTSTFLSLNTHTRTRALSEAYITEYLMAAERLSVRGRLARLQTANGIFMCEQGDGCWSDTSLWSFPSLTKNRPSDAATSGRTVADGGKMDALAAVEPRGNWLRSAEAPDVPLLQRDFSASPWGDLGEQTLLNQGLGSPLWAGLRLQVAWSSTCLFLQHLMLLYLMETNETWQKRKLSTEPKQRWMFSSSFCDCLYYHICQRAC